jgi:hypothetical protein
MSPVRSWDEVQGAAEAEPAEPERCPLAVHCRRTLVTVVTHDAYGRLTRSVQCPVHGDVRIERE